MTNSAILRRAVLTAAVLCASSAGLGAGEDLAVLGKGADKLLHADLMRQMKAQYDRRAREVAAALKSPAALKARQDRLWRAYRTIIGELPERIARC